MSMVAHKIRGNNRGGVHKIWGNIVQTALAEPVVVADASVGGGSTSLHLPFCEIAEKRKLSFNQIHSLTTVLNN